jgi:hypothetical protein
MNMDNSQIGNTPSEQLFKNNDDTYNLDQLLSVEIVTTSQPLIEFNTANMIPSQIQLIDNLEENGILTRRQQARRRRRQRQRQRRRENQEALQQQQAPQQQHRQRHQHRQQQQHPQQQQQQQQQQRQQQLLRRQRRQRRYEQWQERLRQRPQQQQQHYFNHMSTHYDSFELSMEEMFNDRQLEAYEIENTHPKERSDQEQLNAIEEFNSLELLAIIQDHIQPFDQSNTDIQLH